MLAFPTTDTVIQLVHWVQTWARF